MLFPIRFPAWPSPSVTFFEEPLQVFRGFESIGALPLLEPITGGGPQPCAEGQTFPARLLDEAVSVFIGDYELYSGHRLLYPRLIMCMYITHYQTVRSNSSIPSVSLSGVGG